MAKTPKVEPEEAVVADVPSVAVEEPPAESAFHTPPAGLVTLILMDEHEQCPIETITLPAHTRAPSVTTEHGTFIAARQQDETTWIYRFTRY